MPARFLAIKNFDRFQHYHDDRPVAWIKLYTALLDDYAFLNLSEVAQAQLLKLWLLAGRMKNRIPNDLRFIQAKIGSPKAPQIALLIEGGWLVEVSENATESLDDSRKDSREGLEDSYGNSSPHALARGEERRGEKRRGEKKRPPLSRAEPKFAWIGDLRAAHEAVHGPGSFTPGLGARFAKSWAGLVTHHGVEKCARVWTFAQTTGTEKERGFRTVEKVAESFSLYDPDRAVDGAAA